MRIGDRTHCKQGHPFSPENTRWSKGRSHRICRTCVRDAARRYYAKKNRHIPPREFFCRNGHLRSEDNLRRTKQGLLCRSCDRARRRRYYQKLRSDLEALGIRIRGRQKTSANNPAITTT